MKYITSLFLCTSLLLAVEDYAIKPAGTLQLRYDDRTKEYTSLGQKILKEKKIHYNDYIVGGTFGVDTLWQDYTFNVLVYGVGRLHKKNENELKM